MKAPDLAQLQKIFQQAILQPDSAVSDFIAGEDAEQRFAIYRNAYRLRLTDALKVEFPHLGRWLGEEAFVGMAGDFIAACPSQYASIRWYGKQLPSFLQSHPPWSRQPQLAEMARFEWALGEAFDCPDAQPLTTDALMTVALESWPGLVFHFHPSVRLLDLTYPVAQVWKAFQEDKSPPVCKPSDKPVTWLIWRNGLKSFFRSLKAPEAQALKTALEGKNFAEICEGLTHWRDEMNAAEKAALMLRQWLEEGLIVEVKIE